jgi:CRP-like cAMP-binding protein
VLKEKIVTHHDEMWQFLQKQGMVLDCFYSPIEGEVCLVRKGEGGPAVAIGDHEIYKERAKRYAIEKAYIKVISKGTEDE